MSAILDSHDQDVLTRSHQTAHLLLDDLREMVSADHPLLSEYAQDMLATAADLNQRLCRLVAVCAPIAPEDKDVNPEVGPAFGRWVPLRQVARE